MAVTIAVANSKGGCGKTTTSLNLAGGFAAVGYRVLVIDADPQRSATRIRNQHEQSTFPFEIIQLASKTIHREVPKLLANSAYEIVIIDCPPAEAAINQSALNAADYVIMPVIPSPFDYQASEDMLAMIDRAVVTRPGLKAFVLVNGKLPNDRLGNTARQAAESFFCQNEFPVRVLQTEVHNRTAFRQAPLAGKTILDFAPGSAAADDIIALTKEVIECLSKPSI